MLWNSMPLLLGVCLLTSASDLDASKSVLESGRARRSVNYKFNDTDPGNLPEYFCLRPGHTEIHGQTEGKIITLEEGQFSYENNQFCQWKLDAGAGRRIQILVVQWELQYAPPQALCGGYDHIKVTDSAGFEVSWCQILPVFQSPFYINSRGPTMSVTFQSDRINPKNQYYSGGELRFRSFDSNECPPNWLSHKDVCFTLKNIAQIWSDGQKTCNMERANLASIVSQQEFDFLQMAYMGFSGKVWFGLNDKEDFGTFKWMDNSSAAGAFKAMHSLKVSPFNHCGQVSFGDGTVEMGGCEERAAVLCRTEKGKVSTPYPIPQFKTDKGSEKESKKGRGLLIGVLIPSILVLLAIIAGLILYNQRRKLSCFRQTTHGKRSQDSPRESTPSLAQPSAPIIDDDIHPAAPPTYEEAIMSSPV